jgi:fatty-acid desaturase
MNSDKRRQLQQWEQELRDRELAVRLRELEAEISQQQSSHRTHLKNAEPQTQPLSLLKRFYRKLENVAKFIGIVVLVVIGIQVASWLAGTFIVIGIVWLAYKIFFEND